MKCVTDNCTYSCDEVCELEAYGDIAGLGVLLGFLITAYMVVILLLGYYVFIYDPSLTPFRAIDDRETRTPHPNIADEIIIGLVRKIHFFNNSRISSQAAQANGSQVEATLNKCVLLFADIQLVTGTAILISGFSTIRCGLSTYHWQLIVYLAWFSSITHLSALTFLRHYFQSHRTERLCRTVGMFLMLVLLCFAIVPTTHFFWLDPDDESATKSSVLPNHHASCYYWRPPHTRTNSFQSILFSIFLLAYGYFVRLGKMSSRLTAAPHRIVGALKEKERSASNNWQPSISGSWRQALNSIVLEPLWVALLRWILIQVDTFTSIFVEIFWLVVSVLWGTNKIFIARSFSPGGENTWTFGQVLPLVLLAAPLLSVVEYFVEYKTGRNITKFSQVPQPIQMTTLPGPGRRGTENVGLGTSSHNILPYDSSYAGALFLTAWYYLNVTIFFYRAPSNYVVVLITLSVEVLLFQPIIQILWILWSLWLEKVQFRATIVSSLRILVFFALVLTSSKEFWFGGLTAVEFRNPGIIISTLVTIYALFLSWLVVELKTRGRGEIPDTTRDKWKQYLPQIFTSFAPLSGSINYLLLSGEYGSNTGIFLAACLFVQLCLIIVEESFSRHAVSRRWTQLFHAIFFVLVWVAIMICEWTGVASSSFPYFSFWSVLEVFFTLVTSFSLLSIGWCVWKMIWLVIESRT